MISAPGALLAPLRLPDAFEAFELVRLSDTFALVAALFALIGGLLSRVGSLVSLVGDPVADICR